MVNASMWCLPTHVQKEWCVGFHYRNNKEIIYFNDERVILQHDVDTDIPVTYLSSFSINQHSIVVLINYYNS